MPTSGYGQHEEYVHGHNRLNKAYENERGRKTVQSVQWRAVGQHIITLSSNITEKKRCADAAPMCCVNRALGGQT